MRLVVVWSLMLVLVAMAAAAEDVVIRSAVSPEEPWVGQRARLTVDVLGPDGWAQISDVADVQFDGTYIWANQWQTSYIYRILEGDPSQVVRYTLPAEVCPEGRPNGIAWDAEQGLFFLTGQTCEKIWKARFR